MGRKTGWALGALSGLALASPAWAQDEAPKGGAREEAAEVLVAATRRADPAFGLPWSTDVLGAREIVTERMRRTLPDALLDVPGVMVQRTSYGQASPFVRGFTGYHTVLLVDGIRLNNSTFRSGPNQYWSTVDPLSVERVELVRGPASVMHGSDAVGGVVNAVARRRTSFEPGLHGGARSYVRWASAEDSWTARLEVEGNQDDLGFLAGVNTKSYDDLRSGGRHDRLDETGYRERDGDVRIDFRESECSTWAFGAQRVVQDEVPRTHTTVESVPFHGTLPGDELRRDLDQRRDLVYLRNRRVVGAVFADEIEATLSFHGQYEEQKRVRDTNPVRHDLSGVDVETIGFQIHAEKDTAIGLVSYGFEGWNDRVESYRRDYEDGALTLARIQGPVADDAGYRMLGVYAQDEFELGGTTFTAGARWTRAHADADEVDDPRVPGADPATPGNVLSLEDTWRNVSASLRAVRPLAERWNVFGGVSQGFRAPNLSDLTRLDDTSGVETPSPDLDPERFVQGELGVKHEGGGWTAQAAVWRTWIRDLIVPSPTGATIGGTPEVRKDNVGDGWAHGLEAEVAYEVDEAWTVALGGTWQRGRVDQILPNGTVVRRPLSRMAPLTGTVTVAWREPGSPVRAWVSGRFADAQDELSLKDETDTQRIPPGGTPGYGVVSLGASWEITENLTASFAVENVFDKAYRIHGSGVNEAGRSLVLAIDLRL